MVAGLLWPAEGKSQSVADLQPWVDGHSQILKPSEETPTGETRLVGDWNGFSVLVCQDADGTLLHAGISMTDVTGNDRVIRFLERLALAEQILPFYQVSDYLASHQMSVTTGPAGKNRFLYPVRIAAGETGWQVTFRSGWGLQIPPFFLPLSGLEKEALDNQMARLIRQPTDREPMNMETTGKLVRGDSTVWLGGLFRAVWHMNGKPVWSADYPRESLLTMIADFRGQGGVSPVDVTHHTYGNQTATYRATWNGVAAGVLAGSDIWMAEELDPTGLTTVTVLAVDRVFRHLHMLVLKVKGNVVSETNSVIQADLYTYIRQDNVTSWLKTHDGTHGGLNIKVIR